MKNLTIETKTKMAIELVIIDAIENGHSNTNQLINYLQTKVFKMAVKNYISLMN